MKLQPLPSEIIEPYLKEFMAYLVEGIGLGLFKVDEARQDFKGVEHFISHCAGIHARIATSNELERFLKLPDNDMKELCKKVVMSSTNEQ